MKKITIFHQIIAPYRIDFFNELSHNYDCSIHLFWRNLKNQKFEYKNILAQLHFRPDFIVKEELGLIKWMKSIWKTISDEKPQIVIVGEYGISTFLTVIHRFFTKSNYKIVNICDDSYNMVSEDNYFTLRHKYAQKLAVPYMDEIVNVEPRTAEWYQDKYKKGVFFPIICDDKIAAIRQNKVLPISEEYVKKYSLEGKKVLLFVGRLVALKNIAFAIDGFVKASVPDSVFVIVGDGEEMENLKKMSENCQNIIFTGRLEGDNLYAWYNIASVLTLPSYQEAFGAVTNEALVAGCNALVSKDAGSNCLIDNGENGYIIDPNDMCDYISKLVMTINGTLPVNLPLTVRKSLMPKSFADYFSVVKNRMDCLLKS